MQKLGKPACCMKFGQVGCLPEEKRAPVMKGALVFGSIAVVFVALSLLGLAESQNLLEHFHWAKGTVHVGASSRVNASLNCDDSNGACTGASVSQFYVGLKTVLKVRTFQNGGQTHRKWEWGGGECLNVTHFGRNDIPDASDEVHEVAAAFCNQCRAASMATFKSAIIALVAAVMCVKFDLARLKPDTDANFNKFMATVFAGTLSMVSGFIALSKFAYGCYKTAPDSVILNGKPAHMEWKYG